jgi:hypothetical protein
MVIVRHKSRPPRPAGKTCPRPQGFGASVAARHALALPWPLPWRPLHLGPASASRPRPSTGDHAIAIGIGRANIDGPPPCPCRPAPVPRPTAGRRRRHPCGRRHLGGAVGRRLRPVHLHRGQFLGRQAAVLVGIGGGEPGRAQAWISASVSLPSLSASISSNRSRSIRPGRGPCHAGQHGQGGRRQAAAPASGDQRQEVGLLHRSLHRLAGGQVCLALMPDKRRRPEFPSPSVRRTSGHSRPRGLWNPRATG